MTQPPVASGGSRRWVRSSPWPLVAACFLCGLFLPAVLAHYLPGQAGAAGVTPAGLAASFLLHLGLLAVLLALLPLEGAGKMPALQRWPFARAYLSGAVGVVAAFVGWRVSPWSGATWGQTAALAAICAAQGAGLCGLGACLAGLTPCCPRAGRMLLLGVLVLGTTSLFWSRPVLERLQREGAPQAPAAAGAVVAVCPLTACAAAWNEADAGFDLLKSPVTYRVWIGSYQVVPYPRVWPYTRRGDGQGFAFGLAATYALWGAGLLLLGEFVNWATGRVRGWRRVGN